MEDIIRTLKNALVPHEYRDVVDSVVDEDSLKQVYNYLTGELEKKESYNPSGMDQGRFGGLDDDQFDVVDEEGSTNESGGVLGDVMNMFNPVEKHEWSPEEDDIRMGEYDDLEGLDEERAFGRTRYSRPRRTRKYRSRRRTRRSRSRRAKRTSRKIRRRRVSRR